MKHKINEQWQKVKEWWAQLAVREKQAVTIGGILFGIFIIYRAIWSPLVSHVDEMRTKIQAEKKTLAWMQNVDKEMRKVEKQTQDRPKMTSPVMLLSYLQKQINQHGLDQYLTDLKQANTDAVEMHFQKVDFDKLIAFLIAVVKEQSVSISQMSAIASDTPGIVNADLVVKME